MTQYWLKMTNIANFEIDRKAKFEFTGFKERIKNHCSTVEIGDKFVYYIARIRKFGAICTVESKLYVDRKPHWPETDELWPCRFKLKPELILPSKSMLDVVHLVPYLNFITQKQKQLAWGTAFLGSLKRIPKEDFDLIEREMKRLSINIKNQTKPIK